MDECPHGLGTPSACPECMDAGPVATPRPDPRQVIEAERWIEARYEGWCAHNGCRIDVGDWIGITDLGWCCERCAV